MRVRVSLDFDILIESFISLCIIETVGAIFPAKFHRSAASAKTIRSITITFLVTIGDNRRVLYDQVSIINDWCNYLRKIKSFREVGYDIVYLDETWVNQNHCTDYMWIF
jgi:hypothetical protein